MRLAEANHDLARRTRFRGPGATLHRGDDLGAVMAHEIAQAGNRKADDGKGDEGGEHRQFLPVLPMMFL